jgi:hypothetical protein
MHSPFVVVGQSLSLISAILDSPLPGHTVLHSSKDCMRSSNATQNRALVLRLPGYKPFHLPSPRFS